MTDLPEPWRSWTSEVEVDVDVDGERILEDPDGNRYVAPPCVRLVAIYGDAPAGLPEQIELTWECEYPSVADLVVLVDATGALARRRWQDMEPRDITG